MTLAEIKIDRAKWEEKIAAEVKAHKEKVAGFKWELDELKRQEEMILNNVDPGKILQAEHILSVRGKYTGFGEDASSVDEAIRDLAQDRGKNLYTHYIGTKDYSGFSHQGIWWTEYGYGPRHGHVVFAIGLTEALKKDGRKLTDEEIECCIYFLEILKSKRWRKNECA